MIPAKDLVLVVDDDLAVRESLEFALQLEGIEVHVCGSGPELLRYPDLADARCLVLDYKMPVMDGLEVLNQLLDRGIHLPVILVTSHATLRLRRRATAAGVWAILEKPLLDSALIDSIRGALGLS